MKFQALPFFEPATGLVYVRARWYDPNTGSFLSPDPKGYVDSSNLYAFAGGDPVNRRDPRGEDVYDDKAQAYIKWWSDQMGQLQARRNALGPLYAKQISTPELRQHSLDTLMEMQLLDAYLMVGLPGRAQYAVDFFSRAAAKNDSSVLNLSFDQVQQRISRQFDETEAQAQSAAGIFAMARALSMKGRSASPAYRERSAEKVPPLKTGIELGVRPTIRLSRSKFTPQQIDLINRKYGIANMRLAGGEEKGVKGANVKYSNNASRRYVRDELYPNQTIRETKIPQGLNVDESVPRSIGGRQVRPNQNFLPDDLNSTLGGYELQAMKSLPPGTKVLGFNVEWVP